MLPGGDTAGVQLDGAAVVGGVRVHVEALARVGDRTGAAGYGADAEAHLALIAPPQPQENYATPQQRTSGYQRALIKAGLPIDPALLQPAPHYRRAAGYTAAQVLLALPQPPDAIFCFSDLLAMGAIRAVFDAGLSVPADVAVIGIDDIEEGRFSRPTLSTVSLDTPHIARHAVERLSARIEDPDRPAAQITASHLVLPRESTQ